MATDVEYHILALMNQCNKFALQIEKDGMTVSNESWT